MSLADYNVVQAARFVTAAAQSASDSAVAAQAALKETGTATDSQTQAANNLVASTASALKNALDAQGVAVNQAKKDAPSSTSYTGIN